MKIKTRKICPNCRAPQELTYKWIRNKEYGKTIKTCPVCHTKYIDMNCFEPALEPYDDYLFKVIIALSFATLVSGLFCGIQAVLIDIVISVLWDIEIVPTEIEPKLFWIVTIITWLLLVMREVYLAKKSAGGWRKTWEESEERLKNIDYAIMLANHGFDVPEKFLPKGYNLNISMKDRIQHFL